MSLPTEKVRDEIAKAFEKEPTRLKVSGELLTNEHTDKIDGAEVDVVWNEQRETL